MSRIPLIIGTIVFLVALGVFAWATDAVEYLGHQPETCNNCHVMTEQYEGWFHSAHRAWAECADCHIPQENFIRYYSYKARSGIKDVVSFTLGTYPVAIRANEETRTILQANCMRCHAATVQDVVMAGQEFDRNCWDCHRHTAHGERRDVLVLIQDKEVYGDEDH